MLFLDGGYVLFHSTGRLGLWWIVPAFCTMIMALILFELYIGNVVEPTKEMIERRIEQRKAFEQERKDHQAMCEKRIKPQDYQLNEVAIKKHLANVKYDVDDTTFPRREDLILLRLNQLSLEFLKLKNELKNRSNKEDV
jgi:predicted membrane protein